MALSVAFRTPTPLNSMDLQWGQRVEDSRAGAWVMAPHCRLSPYCRRQGPRDLELTAWRSVRGGRCAGRRPGGSPPALP